jgi:HAD superfamily phosphoserine phosphatase-like hydrolase
MNVATDLEGTLTTGRTWSGVGRYLKRYGPALPYYLFLLAHLPGVLLVKAGLLDRQAYGHRWIVDEARLLKGWSSDDLARMGEWVVEHEMWPRRREAVLAELAAHALNGARVILASGTYMPVAEAFARRAGIPVAVATPLDVRDGRATGRLSGALSVKAAKVERLNAVLNGEPLDAAYGDTVADMPMLEMSRTPVAVCPDARLRQIAQQRGWRIFDTPAVAVM